MTNAWEAAGYSTQEEWAQAGWPAPLDPETGRSWEGYKMLRMEAGRHPSGRKMTDEDWLNPYTQHILDFVRIRRLYDNPLWNWASQMRAKYPNYPYPGLNMEDLLRRMFPDWYGGETAKPAEETRKPAELKPAVVPPAEVIPAPAVPPALEGWLGWTPGIPEGAKGQRVARGVAGATVPTREPSQPLKQWQAWGRKPGFEEGVTRKEIAAGKAGAEVAAGARPVGMGGVPGAPSSIDALIERAKALFKPPTVPKPTEATVSPPLAPLVVAPIVPLTPEQEGIRLNLLDILKAPYTYYLKPLFQGLYELAKIPERAIYMRGKLLEGASDVPSTISAMLGIPPLTADELKEEAAMQAEAARKYGWRGYIFRPGYGGILAIEEALPSEEAWNRAQIKEAWDLGEIGYSLIVDPAKHEDAWQMLETGAPISEIMKKHEHLGVELLGNILIDPAWLIPPAWFEKILPVGKVLSLATRGLTKVPGINYLIDVTKAGRLKTFGYAISDSMDRFMLNIPEGESVGSWLGRLLTGEEDVLSTLGIYDRKILTEAAATFKRRDSTWQALITKYSPKVLAGMPPAERAAANAARDRSLYALAERIIRKTAPADLAEMEALIEQDPRKIGRWIAEGLINLKRVELGLKPIEGRGALYRGMAFAAQLWKETILPINIAFHQMNLLDSTVRMALRGYFWDPGDLPVLEHVLQKLTGRQPLEVRIAKELEELGLTLPRELQTGLIRELMDTEGYRLKTRYAMRKVPVPFIGKPTAVLDAFKKLTGNDLVTWAAESSTKGGLTGKIGKLIGAVRFEEATIPIMQAQEMGEGYQFLAKALNRMNLASLVEAGAENLNIEPLVRITTFWKESEPLFNHARLGVADLIENTLLESNPGREAIIKEIGDQVRNPNVVQSVADLGALLDRYIAEAGPKLDAFTMSFTHAPSNKVLQQIGSQIADFAKKPGMEDDLNDIIAYGQRLAEENYSKVLAQISPGEATVDQLRLAGAPERLPDEILQRQAQADAAIRRAYKRMGQAVKRIEDIRGSDLSFLELGRSVTSRVNREIWQPHWDWYYDEFWPAFEAKLDHAKFTGDSLRVSELWAEFRATVPGKFDEVGERAAAYVDDLTREFLEGVPTDELIKALGVIPEERVAEAVGGVRPRPPYKYARGYEAEWWEVTSSDFGQFGVRAYGPTDAINEAKRAVREGGEKATGTWQAFVRPPAPTAETVAPEVAEEAPGLVDRILQQETERVKIEDANLLERARALRDDTLTALREMQEQALTKLGAAREAAEAVPETLVGLDELKSQAMRQMADGYEGAVAKGIDTVHELFYDYAARKGIDELLWWGSPFTIYQTRNPFGWAKAVSYRPAIVNVIRRTMAYTEAERQARALPERFKGTVPIPDAITRPLIDRGIIPEGYYSADVRPFFTIWQQIPLLSGDLPWDWEKEPLLGKIIRAGEFIGLRPYPWWQIGAEKLQDVLKLGVFDGLKRYPWWQMTLDQLGAYGSVPAGDLTYITKYLRAITKAAGHEVDIEKPLREWRDRNDQTGIARYYANLRLLDYFFNEEISMGDLVEAVGNPGNANFDRAQQEAADWQYQAAIVRGLETFTVKNATPAEQKARLLQREYFALPPDQRPAFRDDNPLLAAYWAILRDPAEAEQSRIYQRRERWTEAMRSVSAAAIAKTNLGTKKYEDIVDMRRNLLDQVEQLFPYQPSELVSCGLRYEAQKYFEMTGGFFDEEGGLKEEFEWADYYAAKDAFMNELVADMGDPSPRLEFERYLAKSEPPEDAILRAWETLYADPVWEDVTTEAKAKANEGRKDVQGLLGEVLRLHPDWTAEQIYQAKKAAGQIAPWDTWARRNQPLRGALESVLWSGYMGLDDLARKDFRQYIEEHPGIDPRIAITFEEIILPREIEKAQKIWKRDMNLVSTKVLLILADKLGGLQDLQREGFQREIEAAEKEYELQRIEEQPEAGGGRPPGMAAPMPAMQQAPVGPTEGQIGEAPPQSPAPSEEPTEARYPGGTFVPTRTPQEEAEYDQAQTEMQAWVATGKQGDWTPLMEKWFGTNKGPSPAGSFWEYYWAEIPPGRIAAEIRGDPIIEMLLNKAFRTVYDVKPGVYEQALGILQAWREAHPEVPGDPQEWAVVRQITDKYWELKDTGNTKEASALWQYFAPLLEKYYPSEQGTTVSGGGARRYAGGGGGGLRPRYDSWDDFTKTVEPGLAQLIQYFYQTPEDRREAYAKSHPELWKWFKDTSRSLRGYLEYLYKQWQSKQTRHDWERYVAWRP